MADQKYIGDYLRLAAEELGDKEFLICKDRTLSWAEASAEADSVATFIGGKLGGCQQEVVGILLPDSWQFVVSYFGTVNSGNIAMPLDITFKKLELDYVIGAIKPEFVIVNNQTKHLVEGPAVLIEDILATKSVSTSVQYELPPDEQIATLFFSSGTTGRPKPIPNTHTNQLWDVAAIAGPMGWTINDRVLITLHLAHRHGLVICLLGAVYHGNSVYLEERFNPEKILEKLNSGKITLFSSVPAAYAVLIKQSPQAKFDFSSVRLFASSSSALSPALRSAFKARFGHEILDRYGTSETGSIAIKTSSSGSSFGDVLDGVEIRLETDGAVALRSPGVFPGYYHNRAATAASRTSDGWWLTGDIGTIINGKLSLKGRSKEKIDRGGYSVFPQDIEWALLQNPDIQEVKVTGLPNTDGGMNPEEKIIAFFTGSIDVQNLEEYSKLNLPRSWRPDVFFKLDRIPKTPNGKPKLADLKKLAEGAV